MQWMVLSWPTLILLGVGLRMSLRLTYGIRGPEPGDPVYALVNTAAWVLMGLGVVPIVFGGFVTVFGSILIMMAAATDIEMVIQQRAGQRRSICRMLSLIVERGAQLQSSALVAGLTMRGNVGRAARRLFAGLSRGKPLITAVADDPGALPREALAYLSAGSSRDTRAAALRELSRPDHGELTTLWRSCIDRASYLVSVLLFMSCVLAFVMIKIVPEFRSIFYEFNLDLPPMTELLVSISDFTVDVLILPLMLLLAGTMILSIVIGSYYLCDLQPLQFVSERLLRGRRVADVLRIIALATEHREPLPEMLSRVGKAYPSAPIRRQVTQTAVEVAAGADWRDALRNAGIINQAERALLYTAERVGNLPWALRETASRRENIMVYKLSNRLQVLYPLIILMLGSIIGFYAIALFIPLIKLIDGLSR